MTGPRTMDSRTRLPSLSRRKSTKQLINRYEAMAGPTTLAEPTVQQSLTKDRPSVRQSFRNLLGLFKKADGKMKLNNVFSARRSPSASRHDESLVSHRSSSAPTTAVPLSGSLLYLSRPSSSTSNTTILPVVWTTCTATLKGDSISLSWLSLQGLPNTYSVSLKGCTDVRSLTVAQLEDEELILLPRNAGIDEFRLFELVFGDKKEKFATTSVRERASWDISCRHLQSDALAYHDQDAPSEDHPLPPSPSARSLPALPDHDVLSLLSSAQPDIRAGHAISMVDRDPSESSSIHPLDKPRNGSKFQSTRIETINVEKPLPGVMVQEPMHRKSSTGTESIFDAYGGSYSFFPDESLHAMKAPTEPTDATFDYIQPLKDDLQQISNKLIGLRENVDSGLAITRQRIQDINVRFGHTETLLKSLSNDLARMAASDPPVPPVNPQIEHLIQAMESLQRSLYTELSVVKESLDVTRLSLQSSEHVATSQETPQSGDLNNSTSSKAMQEKLEVILTVLNDKTELQGIQDLLREEGNQRALQGQQQTDSVRYLNELNSAVHGAVEQIRNVLGCDVEGDQDIGSLFKLMQDIRTCTTTLQISIDNLAGFSNSKNTFSPDSIAELLTRQNQEHQNFLRGIAAELSNEIRGERLRFVDAMKEATEINVQTHVEEFKKELKREVHGMTQEIGRLYRERQTMENQIAELFAFYTKQKQGIPFAANAMHQAPPFVQAPDPSQRRPLPSPQRHRPGY
ncbi:hypothetical protein ARMGADRAFT_1105876 [Armillaria gallica]|uniref:PH domain-containing protein n=1 Tax=Armillaria gallica TaxID=47427 RepID=A0A2H3DIW4_ARMGA|nr:hypothetical protein ARMGADRAFT_1105876 [Armillaria gallica]